MSDPFTISIMGSSHSEGMLADTAIATVPPVWYLNGALLVEIVGRSLRDLSEDCAADLNRQLHHAEWQFTSDPEVVERLGMHEEGCVNCRLGTDRALEYLRDNPGKEVAVGAIWVVK